MSSDREVPVPGTGLVIGVLAAALVGTAVLRAGRVRVPSVSSPRDGDGPHSGPYGSRHSGPYVGPAAGRSWPDMRLDVNSATDVELNALPGIGPRLAERVAADREANGPFESIEDLQRVRGIGPRLVERVRPYVICDP